MAIEPGLYAAPEGLPEEEGPELEVEVEFEGSPDIMLLEDGGVEITYGEETTSLADAPFDANLAEYMDESDLHSLGSELMGDIEADTQSRKEWADAFVKGLEVLGMKYEERITPWEGACGVFSTVLSEAAIRFQAECMGETFPAAGPVMSKVVGDETKEKREAAHRVQADMNYQLTERMVEYRSEHERLLYSLGLAGSAFKKVYYDPSLGRQVALYIPAEDVLVPYGASNIETAERVTHVMRKTKNEMARLQAAGFYIDEDLGEPEPFHSDIEEIKAEEEGYTLNEDDRYCIYEVHAELILMDVDGGAEGGDGLAKPYVVAIERGSGKVLSIRRNWDQEDPLALKRQHFVHYTYVPGFGFYGLGLIHIVGGYAKAGTSLIRQLVDAGTLSNLPGGLKTKGLRAKGDDTPIQPGEFRDVDVPSGAIKDNIMALPYKEPSQTLLRLLEIITQEGRRLAAISDINVSDMSANAPVGTTLALLERTLKPMAAVQARVHYAMKLEFKLLKAIIADYASEDYDYQPATGQVTARKQDYELVDVIPVSDPNNATLAQRVVQYQAVLQMAQQAPQIYDLPQLHRQMIDVIGVKNAEKIVPLPEDANPVDPVSENMAALTGKPLRAFIYQDHDAHIAAHTAFIQDPMIAQMIGQNPQAQQIMGALQAHITEHLAFSYRQQIEDRLGAPLPAPDAQLPEDMEIQLSRLVADAGKQLTAAHKQQAAQQQAQQIAEDPNFQLRKREVAIKEAEQQRKSQKDMADSALEQGELMRKAQKDRVDAAVERERLKIEQTELAIDAAEKDQRLAQVRREAERQFQMDMLNALRAPQGGNNG
jgi:hypothetical protein